MPHESDAFPMMYTMESFLAKAMLGHWISSTAPSYNFEGFCLTHVILTSGACWGGSEQRLLTPDPLNPADPADPGMNSKSRIYICFYSKKCSDLTPVQCFFTFSYPSHLKHLFLRAFLEDGLSEMLSKLGVLAETSTNK